jgi:Retrotransposon gag protein
MPPRRIREAIPPPEERGSGERGSGVEDNGAALNVPVVPINNGAAINAPVAPIVGANNAPAAGGVPEPQVVINLEGFMQSFQGLIQTMQQQIVQQPALAPRLEMPALDRFMKLAPPYFKGESRPEVAEFWLSEIEKKFRAMRCPEEEKVNLAAYVLQDHADVWWKAKMRTTFVGYDDYVPWEEFLEAFRANYFPEHVRDAKEQEFLSLVQGNMTVAEYEAKFSALGQYASHIFDDPRRKVKKFVGGLRSSVRRYVATQDPGTYTTALRLAHLAEHENTR